MLSEFRFEQTDPARFYGAVARDTVELVGDLAGTTGTGLDGALVLDVGGGPGYFEDAFAARGAVYVPVEPDPSETHAAGITASRGVRGSGLALPVADGAVDICVSSNVAEHVRDPWAMGDEMLRVTRPGGLVVLSYTLWYGPFGGHEMGLTHYAGGARAARWYTRRHGHPPKNLYGTSLFKVTAAEGLRWSRTVSGARLVAAFPRYHPAWAWWILRVPGLRELLASNLVLVFVKSPPIAAPER
ncbi:class I SAM-dependent methyltransferase [Tsukamurella sp. 8F]|uniref:class I SAM-dependent methyltransferase n=1 Tax=unclassified Tsukamurella TaxID=2633480 RepID=UPI0023B91CFB|nr:MULTISPECIES: class I SAM-dependent methyltransferase [unclassified Tsukamurella]MDF0529886.1 class I SAM-dependent methyltransferase [Tsukamurella sp. 8J]MDF0588659.1 class I SAM-dependent methyltransferase [Tsukamurella sp. 8F]